MNLKQDEKNLTEWYLKNLRKLPWRESLDPYKIWISEVMLQQTTVVAVIPYFERFLNRFPNVNVLAAARVEDVYEQWAGLGYYSRARNLHLSAQQIAKKEFPKTSAELLTLPGFGPYISNAVASIAFNEAVGVLDGNVIRVLCRKHGLKIQWWKSAERKQLQKISHSLVSYGEPRVVNQAMMELGATICTPQKTLCFSCPWVKSCKAYSEDRVSILPLKKPKKNSEYWLWTPHVNLNGNKVALVKNNYAPFLKGKLIFPGSVVMKKERPKSFDIKHAITHHQIFIKMIKKNVREKNVQWIPMDKLKSVNPSSLLLKIIERARSS